MRFTYSKLFTDQQNLTTLTSRCQFFHFYYCDIQYNVLHRLISFFLLVSYNAGLIINFNDLKYKNAHYIIKMYNLYGKNTIYNIKSALDSNDKDCCYYVFKRVVLHWSCCLMKWKQISSLRRTCFALKASVWQLYVPICLNPAYMQHIITSSPCS